MRILFTMGHPHLPQGGGGVQSSTHHLARRLSERGHPAAVACTLNGGDWTALRARIAKRLARSRFGVDTRLGYPVYRAWDLGAIGEVAARFRPDVAVVQHGRPVETARRLRACGVPVCFYFRNVEFEDMGGDPRAIDGAGFIANSRFTASRAREALGVEAAVVPPGIDPAQYRTQSTRRTVTLINPHPLKGGDIAAEVARRCPDIPFVFVETWSESRTPEARAALAQSLAGLGNVTVVPRTGDMRGIYGHTRILLAPSRWEEAWGRVACEAHCSGIPVIGSRRGGLPEAIGEGGVLLDPDGPIEEWTAAVRRLWDDEAEYARLVEAAHAAARRPILNDDVQLATLLGELEAARARSGSAARPAPGLLAAETS